MYWQEQPKQLRLDTEWRKVCPICRTFDPPTEPAYGCPECGEGATLSQLGDPVPELCPWCGDGKLELVTENACAECGQGEVEEREVFPCPYCGHVRLSRYEYHLCPNRPKEQILGIDRGKQWTEEGKGKVAYLRLQCRAKEERVKVNGRLCPGWRYLVERYEAGDEEAFKNCLFCAYGWGQNPGKVEATGVEPYPHQTVLKM